MSRNKRLVAKLSSLLVFAAAILFFLTPESSFASGSSDLNCGKTTAIAHNVLKVAIPSAKAVHVDRTFTFNTNCGQIVIKALGHKAPLTVIAMTALAKAGYFDQSLCHRVTTVGLYILQCGDPTASGTGGPIEPGSGGSAWGPPDENRPKAAPNDYPAGTVAMANSGRNTNGSQFFIVYKDTTLGPDYTRWGVVVKGLDIVKGVAAAGVAGGGTDGTPEQTIAIETVVVK